MRISMSHDANGFKVKTSLCYMYVSIFECNTTAMKKIEPKRNHLIGLQENKKNLMDVIHPQNEKIADKEVDDIDLDEGGGVDGVNTNQPPFTLDEYLKSNETVILQNVLNELKNANIQKWRDKTIDDLFPALLTNGEMLIEETAVKELNIICMELHCATGQNWSSSNMVKAEIVNVIVKAFGGDSTITVQRQCKKVFHPESLVTSCVNYIKGAEFPKKHIQIPIASLRQIENKCAWYRKSTIHTHAFVPTEMQNQVETLDFFSYPEYSVERGQLEFRTFDFTHVLSNLHTQILTRGLDYCKKEHFEHLSTNKPGILSLALVFEKTDQQNAFTAMRMFNYDVKHYMHENDFTQTADFIKLVRNWHDACNRCGLSADTSVLYLTDMHKFLIKGVNFNAVPFPISGKIH